MTKLISILDYGMGNIQSIRNMLKKAGHNCRMVSTEQEVNDAEKLIIPGVGAFASAMKKLEDKNLVDVITRKVRVDKIPILGICLGMQLLGDASEEAGGIASKGFGFIEGGQVRRFVFNESETHLKIPHMGWNFCSIEKPSRLFTDMWENPKFYFIHSYHFVVQDSADILCLAQHGGPFVSAIERDNIIGVQFHPEKSHKYGLKLLDNFAKFY